MHSPNKSGISCPLHKLRNGLEHSYLKLHDIGSGNQPGNLFHDRMAHSLGCREFERRTLRVLKLERAALIYIALGMEREERSRAAQRGTGGLSTPMTMDTYDYYKAEPYWSI